MIKALFSTTFLGLAMIGHLGAEIYTGPQQGSWGVPENWDTGFLPAVGSGGEATIANGATVDYDAAALNDLKVDFGGSLTISNGSTWSQTTTTHWTQINQGTLTLDNGSLRRGIAGNLVGSWVPGFDGAPVVSEINAKNGSEIEVGPGGNFILGFTNYTTSTLNLTDSSVVVGGELWLGSNTADDNNQIVTLNIADSTITTQGVVGLWVWDYAAAGSSFSINFSGDEGSYIEVADSIGTRPDATGANNQATWESLWDVGVLTAFGESGLTGAFFGDYFATEGTSLREGAVVGAPLIPYRLTLQVPEPS
ncbi:MAG: hypothetical protein EOP84_33975, partial [Verrucomicrobiaceae bacterium]